MLWLRGGKQARTRDGALDQALLGTATLVEHACWHDCAVAANHGSNAGSRLVHAVLQCMLPAAAVGVLRPAADLDHAVSWCDAWRRGVPWQHRDCGAAALPDVGDDGAFGAHD
jgi:hypothetical protein